MKHTHKPRGHIWTHPSAFQQTKEFRNIRYEDCTAAPAKTLVRDEDRDLSSAGREAKRRRIEKLADDFLNGTPLFISSAGPSPQDLKTTIIWNKKSWDEPKFVFPTFDRSEHPPEGSSVWEDVESDAEILERLSRRARPSDQPKSGYAAPNANSGDSAEAVDAEEAQASCGPAKRLKQVKITAGPSEDALRQAAALRARRLQRANSEIPVMPSNIPSLAPVTGVENLPHSEPRYKSQPGSESRRTPQWLSRRQSMVPFAGEDVSDSIDELQRSDVDTPSQIPHRAKESRGIPEKSFNAPLSRAPVPENERQTRSKSAYIAAKSSQNQSTPLLYRKGRLRSRGNDSGDFDSEKKDKSVISETSIQTETPVEQPVAAYVPAAPVDQPLLDASSNQASSSARDPNMSLVEEHLNSVLQSTPNSAGRSSSIKKALQRELRNAGAEITRCESEPPASSDVEQQTSSAQPQPTNESEQEESQQVKSVQEKWAGTQFLLKQAQKDLIPSPAQQSTGLNSTNEATPVREVDSLVEGNVKRGPLKQLSQEPMPSTQQLLGDFEGWSTVKKPRGVLPHSPLPTPTAMGKSRLTSSHPIRPMSSDLDTTNEGARRERSSLRFSIPVASSPVDTGFSYEPARVRRSFSKVEEGHQPIPAETTGNGRSSLRFSVPAASSPIDASLSYEPPPIQNGSPERNLVHSSISARSTRSQTSQQHSTSQRGSARNTQTLLPGTDIVQQNSGPDSFTLRPLTSSVSADRDESTFAHDFINWDETIDDLTRDALCLDDMQNVMTQIG